MNVGIDRVVDPQCGAKDCADDLTNVGVDEIERDIPGSPPEAGRRRWRDCRRRLDTARLESALSTAVNWDRRIHAWWRCLQCPWLFKRLQTGRRGVDLTAG